MSGKLTAEQVRKTVEKHWHDLPAEYDMPEATALPEYSYDWQAIADELNTAMDRPTFDANLEQALSFMRIWISEDAHLGESAISYELEKAEGLRKLDAIESAIAATLGCGECENANDVMKSGEIGFKCSECGSWDDDPHPRFCHNCGRKVKR